MLDTKTNNEGLIATRKAIEDRKAKWQKYDEANRKLKAFEMLCRLQRLADRMIQVGEGSAPNPIGRNYSNGIHKNGGK